MKLTQQQLNIIEGISLGKQYTYNFKGDTIVHGPTSVITINLLLREDVEIKEYFPEERVIKYIKYPTPLKEEPTENTYVYVIDTYAKEPIRRVRYNSTQHKEFLDKGFIHKTYDNAYEHFNQIMY